MTNIILIPKYTVNVTYENGNLESQTHHNNIHAIELALIYV